MTALTLLPSVGTKSLRIREIAVGDTRSFARYMTDIEYQRFLSVRYPNEYAVHQFINRAVARQDRKGRVTWHLAAEGRQSRTVHGDGFIIFHEKNVAEVGWGVDPSAWNNGLGTEIAKALVAIAIERLKARDVWCKIKAHNLASVRVAEKCGMRQDRIVDAGAANSPRAEKIYIYTLGCQDYFDAPY